MCLLLLLLNDCLNKYVFKRFLNVANDGQKSWNFWFRCHSLIHTSNSTVDSQYSATACFLCVGRLQSFYFVTSVYLITRPLRTCCAKIIAAGLLQCCRSVQTQFKVGESLRSHLPSIGSSRSASSTTDRAQHEWAALQHWPTNVY